MVAKIAIRKAGEADGLKIPRPATWNVLLARASRDLLGGAAVGKVTDNRFNDAIMRKITRKLLRMGTSSSSSPRSEKEHSQQPGCLYQQRVCLCQLRLLQLPLPQWRLYLLRTRRWL